MRTYGNSPYEAGYFNLDFHEYMHYLYLPVVMPNQDAGEVLQHGHIRLPRRLEFLRPMIETICDAEQEIDDDGVAQNYVYVSARRGYASPGNPLNRPGWHADGFGSVNDINYVWADRWPTRYATGDFGRISEDHIESARQFNQIIEEYAPDGGADSIEVYSGEPNTLYRLDPTVVHATPIIPAPGGERGFIKVSLSPNRYNLLGNSHNYLFDYDWKMWSRDEVRNDPAWAGGDTGPQKEESRV